MFDHDENLKKNFNFWNNLMFFLGLSFFYCVRIYSFGKFALSALIVFEYIYIYIYIYIYTYIYIYIDR